MTAADETPAQPTCGAHPPYSDGHRWTCGKPPHRDDHEGDGMTWARTRHEDEIRRRNLANAHRDEVVEGSGVAIEPRDFRAQPDAAPAPDGNAGGAGADAILKERAAYKADLFKRVENGHSRGWTFHRVLGTTWRGARAPLLVELAGTRQMLDVMVGGENATMDALRADLAEAIRERDEARAKTEELLDLLRDVWAYGAVPDAVSDQIAKWLGPVTDDGGAG